MTTKDQTVSAPKRIKLSRKKNWRKPEGAVVCSRPSKWGNPFGVQATSTGWCVIDVQTGKSYAGHYTSKSEATRRAVRAYRAHLRAGALQVNTDDVRRELGGKDLCCWCRQGDACHVDVLLSVANPDRPLTLNESIDSGREMQATRCVTGAPGRPQSGRRMKSADGLPVTGEGVATLDPPGTLTARSRVSSPLPGAPGRLSTEGDA